ncbi:hypothetical protein MSG28_012197 [Choristoneura fumiferana]|uniref:Uncharacterized protein n=1 Tax=Choristoneura fumiferana TaxID=7141 RepID=A0ACC0KC10_CHOFU|nr:hypothetical protein MSG28_012197 [Choristoneura fumiferana]
MASNLVKCSNCNVVINELLAFVQNKCDVMNELNIVQICATAFSTEEISGAKKMLFDSVPTSKRKIRRKEGKNQRDLDDIICLIKTVDPEELPIFVARDLCRLPPVTWDHVDVTRLLKDILLLQKEIDSIKNTYVTKDSIDELRTDLVNMKRASIVNNYGFVNSKRGAQIFDSYMNNSGPMGLHQVPPESSNISSEIVTNSYFQNEDNILSPTLVRNNEKSDVLNGSAVSLVHINEREDGNVSPVRESESGAICKLIHADTHTDIPLITTSPEGTEQQMHSEKQVSNNESFNAAKCTTFAFVVGSKPKEVADSSARGSSENTVHENELNDFEEVQKRKKRTANRFIGLTGKAVVSSDVKFKSADIKIPLFINNVDKLTSEQDIINYIAHKTGINISLKKINTLRKRNYNAYKVFVPHTKLQIFLNDGLWPEGVTYRRFVYIKNYDQARKELDGKDNSTNNVE